MIRLLPAIACMGLALPAWAAAKITLNAGEEPDAKAWTQPAAINYVDNPGARASWGVDIAAKVAGQPFPFSAQSMFVRGVLRRNTQTQNEIENYIAELGTKFDLPQSGGTYWLGQASLAYSDKTTFPDPAVRERERSLRPTFTIQPFRSGWESTFGFASAAHTELVGPSWTHSFLPVVAIFYDDVLDATLMGNGVEPSGGVFGAKTTLSVAVSPRFAQYRLVFASSLQEITAFSRAARRRKSFDSIDTLMTASVTYEFGPRSFEGGSGWVPSLGITYTHGDDPLAGKLDQDSVILGFKVSYRNE
jgi:hypothetical protein